jgi:hypothetical protein
MATLLCIGERPRPSVPPTVRFSFQLPPALVLRAQPGRYGPTVHGARLDVGADGLVEIGGYLVLQREAAAAVLDQARRFLDALVRDGGREIAPQAFAGELFWWGGRAERYAVALNSRVALVPAGALPAVLA